MDTTTQPAGGDQQGKDSIMKTWTEWAADSTAWGGRLRLLRELRHMTVEELAGMADVDPVNVRAFEAGTEIPDLLGELALAGALRTTPESLDPAFLILVDDEAPSSGFRGRMAGRTAAVPVPTSDTESFRADYERHFDVSRHALVDGEVPPAYAAWIDAELDVPWRGPSDAQLREIAELDSLREAWLALGRPTSAPQFKLWFFAREPGEPVAAGLMDRDRAARRAGSTGVGGGPYPCGECRKAYLEDLLARRLLGRAGRPASSDRSSQSANQVLSAVLARPTKPHRRS